MKFIIFSVFVWALALFHAWDHRRFEADLRACNAGDGTGDWREVAPAQDSTLYLKRAFVITTRSDVLRYAMPVIFFLFWLLVFHSWLPALMYMAVVAGKWLCVTTALHMHTGTYRVMLGRYVIYKAALRDA